MILPRYDKRTWTSSRKARHSGLRRYVEWVVIQMPRGNQIAPYRRSALDSPMGSCILLSAMRHKIDPRFKDAFLTLLTSAQIYALVTGSFGAAPVGGNGNDQLKLVYGHSFCLYDADKPTVHRRQNNSTVYQPRTVPTVKQIIFLTDKQRNGQRFKDIYALEQACYYQGSLLGMIYGPVWKDVFDPKIERR